MDLLSLLSTINDEYAGLIGAATGLVGATVGLVNLGHIRGDSKNRTRPYIFVEPTPGLHGDGAWDLRVANLGASIANDVRLSVSPAWGPVDKNDSHTPAIKEVLSKPFTLPPGSHLRLMWRLDRPGEKDKRILAGAPENTEITASYKGDIDRKSRRKGYIDKFSVRTDLGKAVPVPTTGSKLTGAENGKELQNIDRALRALTAHVGELRR